MWFIGIAVLVLAVVLAAMLWVVSLIPTAILSFIGAALLVILPLVGVVVWFLSVLAKGMAD